MDDVAEPVGGARQVAGHVDLPAIHLLQPAAAGREPQFVHAVA